MNQQVLYALAHGKNSGHAYSKKIKMHKKQIDKRKAIEWR